MHKNIMEVHEIVLFIITDIYMFVKKSALFSTLFWDFSSAVLRLRLKG